MVYKPISTNLVISHHLLSKSICKSVKLSLPIELIYDKCKYFTLHKKFKKNKNHTKIMQFFLRNSILNTVPYLYFFPQPRFILKDNFFDSFFFVRFLNVKISKRDNKNYLMYKWKIENHEKNLWRTDNGPVWALNGFPPISRASYLFPCDHDFVSLKKTHLFMIAHVLDEKKSIANIK